MLKVRYSMLNPAVSKHARPYSGNPFFDSQQLIPIFRD